MHNQRGRKKRIGKKHMNWTDRKKEIIMGTVLVVCGVVIAVLIVELFLRAFLPSKNALSDDLVRKSDSVLGHVLIPNNNLFHDENGFKNKNTPFQADIVTLGDSHTYGIYKSIDQSWPAFLGEMTGMSVYNMGVGGYGPVQYWSLIDKALSFHPKYIIIGFLVGNDVFDAYNMAYNMDAWKELRSPTFVNDQPMLPSALKETIVPFQGIREFIRDHSVLYDFLAERTLLWREKMGLAKQRNIGVDDWTNDDPDVSLAYRDNEKTKTVFWVGSYSRGVDLKNKNIREGVRISLDLLGRTKNKVEKSKTKLIVALIPMKESVYGEVLAQKIRQNERYTDMIKNETEVREAILAQCEKEEMSCVDLLPGLQHGIKESRTLYSNTWDDHPVAEGYRVYAEIIKKVLTESKL